MYAFIGLLAGVENVFPPVPADTAVALGAFLSHAGRVTALGVFLVTWTANVGTAACVYAAARTVGRRFFETGWGRRLLRPEALARLERLYARHGTWGIFLSRFIPGVRAVVPPFAGVAGLGFVRAMVPTATASAVWYGTLTYVVATVAGKLDEVSRLVAQFNVVALVLALGIALAIAAALWWRRRRRAVGQASGDP